MDDAVSAAGGLPVPTTIVVPCYNEALRLRPEEFLAFAAVHPSVRFLFVNDGSTDDTALVLQTLSARAPDRFEWLDIPHNGGKAASVRSGMLRAFAAGARYVGYWDADLSAPLCEIPRFIQTLDAQPQREICIGARVQLLGRTIERRVHRHYLGRVFATAASLVLRLPVYDTQCGAKLFRAAPDVQALFASAFVTRWCFDVELIARLSQARRRSGGPGPEDVIYELPLNEWRDVEGSKVRAIDFVRGLIEVLRIRHRYLK
jgi:glycosyltransferase involved in cell wall biosynthesis